MQPAAGVLLAVGLEDLLPFAFVLVWLVVQGINLFRRAGQAGPPIGPPRPPADDERMVEVEELLRRSLGLERTPEPPPRPRASKRSKRAVATAAATAAPHGAAGGSDVARHVQEAFARDLVHQAPDAIAAPARAAGSPIVADLVAALHSPASIRQMVILKEVFDRPAERW